MAARSRPVDGLVDLYADAGPALRVVRVGLGQHEVTGELGGGHRGPHRALPVGLSSLPTRLRAMSRATRIAASTMTTARRTQPQAVELDDVLAAVVVVVVVGCVVVVDGCTRVVVVAGTVVVVAGMVVVVGGTVVVVAGAVVVVVAGAVVVVVVSCAAAALATRPSVIGADVIATTSDRGEPVSLRMHGGSLGTPFGRDGDLGPDPGVSLGHVARPATAPWSALPHQALGRPRFVVCDNSG